MIIECICGQKKFEVNSELIPKRWRTIQCGSCDKVWFYKPENLNNENQKDLIIKNEIQKSPPKKANKSVTKDTLTNQNISDLENKKNYEITKYKPEKSLSFTKLLSYLIVLLITFVALLVVIDTFSTYLYQLFPSLEIVIFNLFEILKDIKLFIKDLA
jgi:hypothetical protein